MLNTFTAKLVIKKQLTDDVRLFGFQTEGEFSLHFTPGQYLIVHVPYNGDSRRRLLSIVVPSEETSSFDLLLKLLPGGLVSEYLKNMAVGGVVKFDGPAGVFVLHESPRDKVFIATGTGIAPIMSMIKSIPEYKTKLFWGLKTLKDLYLFNEFKKMTEENSNFSFKICLSRESTLDVVPEEDRKYFSLGRVGTNFESPDLNFDYYLCGDRLIIESLKNFLLEKGIPKEHLFFEKF